MLSTPSRCSPSWLNLKARSEKDRGKQCNRVERLYEVMDKISKECNFVGIQSQAVQEVDQARNRTRSDLCIVQECYRTRSLC